jgi:uncharacterized protein (DUF924 family)
MIKKEAVLSFWFDEIKPAQRWKKDEQFDKEIKHRFYTTYQAAIQCELFRWRETERGRLAEVILLDQFARNMFRGTAQQFAADPLALALAQEAVSLGVDNELTKDECSFLYMPFMHSESIEIHEQALLLFQRNGVQSTLDYEIKHKNIIERFGRYPHRNALLGRKSTEEELAFLSQPGSSF